MRNTTIEISHIYSVSCPTDDKHQVWYNSDEYDRSCRLLELSKIHENTIFILNFDPKTRNPNIALIFKSKICLIKLLIRILTLNLI